MDSDLFIARAIFVAVVLFAVLAPLVVWAARLRSEKDAAFNQMLGDEKERELARRANLNRKVGLTAGLAFMAAGVWAYLDPPMPPFGGKVGSLLHLAYSVHPRYGIAMLLVTLGSVFLVIAGKMKADKSRPPKSVKS